VLDAKGDWILEAVYDRLKLVLYEDYAIAQKSDSLYVFEINSYSKANLIWNTKATDYIQYFEYHYVFAHNLDEVFIFDLWRKTLLTKDKYSNAMHFETYFYSQDKFENYWIRNETDPYN